MFGEQVFVLWKVKSEQVFVRTSVRIHDPRSPELFENIDIGWAGIQTIFNVGLLWIDLSKRGGGSIFYVLQPLTVVESNSLEASRHVLAP